MAEGTDVTPSSQNQIINLNTGGTESLQVLKPSTAPGVSMSQIMSTETENKSRHGIFRVLAGISPGTQVSVADPDMHTKNPLYNPVHSHVTTAYQHHAPVEATFSADNMCNRATASFHSNSMQHREITVGNGI